LQIISQLYDVRIQAWNVLLEMGLSEYALLVKENIDKNEFQRKRVSSSRTVYSLLKADLLTGCVIPPVVLALSSVEGAKDASDTVAFDASLIMDNKESLVILDGLQRTHTIIDLLHEVQASNPDDLARVEDSRLRVEVYVGLNRLGILYRMLTLNTGQTPMSLRQQIEMLYSDYLGKTVEGVELFREADGRNVTQLNQFVFKDVIEGFNAYLNRDELPFDRTSLLENIKSLEKLSKVNSDSELFEAYLVVLHSFLEKASDLIGDATLPIEWTAEHGAAFGENVTRIFKRPQAISGLGSALGKLMDREIIESFDDAIELIGLVEVDDSESFLVSMNTSLDWLKNKTSKIGNAQRNFFTFFFRDLFNEESDSYLNLNSCADSALRKYQDQNI
jgi:hypothetical protein